MRQTLRGLATGSVRLRVSDGGKACVIFGDQFSSWLPVLHEMGLRAVMVLLRSDQMLDAVEALVDDSCVVVCGSDWSVFGSKMPHFGSREVVGLMDGRVSQEILGLATSMNLASVASTSATRKPVQAWQCRHVQVNHESVGGVTCARSRVYRHDSGSVEFAVLPAQSGVSRDVGTVLSASVGTRHFRTAPTARAVVPLAVCQIGSISNPIYHGGGLLPGLIDKRTRVLTPGIYAPPGKWCVRALTYSEVLLCKDVSETVVTKLKDCCPLSDDLLQKLVPGKCLLHGFKRLFGDWNGGVFPRDQASNEWQSLPPRL